MRIPILLASSLAVTACQLLDSAPKDSPAPEPDEWSTMATYDRYVERLREFHTLWGTSTDSAYVANRTKTSPADSIDLLPPDLALPANAKVRWIHSGDAEYHDLDPALRVQVPLRDGIVIEIRGSDMPEDWLTRIQHLPQSDLAPPTITPADKFLEYWTDSISVTSSRPGALIHYTLDGSYPTTSSPVYTGKIPLDHPIWIRAMAEVPGVATSLSARSLLLPAGGWNPAIDYDTLVDSRDGQSYPTVRIGNLTWMAKNLNWLAPGGTSRSLEYGGSYELSQVHASGDSALCPEGWHVSSQADWDSLSVWGTRQPGVYANNVGNALRKDDPHDLYSQTIRLGAAGSDLVDLWGFRAITTEFWTSSKGANQQTTILASLSSGAILEEEVDDTSGTWLRVTPTYGGLWERTEHQAYVRCVKN